MSGAGRGSIFPDGTDPSPSQHQAEDTLGNDPAKPDFSNVQSGSATSAPDFSNVKAGSSTTAPAAAQSYTVVAGDTLSRIAKKFLGSANHWHDIFDANRDQISNPDMIRVGQVLKIPAAAGNKS